MFVKRYVTWVLLALGLVLGWKYFGELRQWLNPQASPPPVIKFDNDTPPAAGNTQAESDTPVQQVSPKATSGIHKCKVNGSVIYTDAPCENPGHEQAMSGGSVTVVKGQRASTSASSGASLPNARDLLGRQDPNDHSILDKHIDNQTR
ncbi:MAG: hypothetical protein EKK47_11730 [Burkholderiales bacterium]|nr:MAG: hypothetical protein EKK47_11730 [Burkholderiales bacterium]